MIFVRKISGAKSICRLKTSLNSLIKLKFRKKNEKAIHLVFMKKLNYENEKFVFSSANARICFLEL